MNDYWELEYKEKLTTAEKAVRCIRNGDTVYVGTCTSTAYDLCDALGDRADELENVTVTCSQILYPNRVMNGNNKKAFKLCTYFMGAQERAARKTGEFVDYTSMHLSQVDIFLKNIRPARVAFFEVSEPDANGYMNYGATGVAINKYIKESAEIIIAQVNPNVPYVLGEDNLIHVSEVAAIVEGGSPLFENVNLPVTKEIELISDYLLNQISDGSCIQLGIGGVANAVGFGLNVKNDLSCHSELITDSIMELMKAGNITNRNKGFVPGKTTAAFSLGTKKLYDFLDHNGDVYFMPFPVINDPLNIAKNEKMISINTALAIDIFGQVCADNLAGKQFSATGGQLDFVRGAQMSKGGKSFIAMPSVGYNKNGEMFSKITARLPFGAAVTTPRSEVQYIVTEYGVANLKMMTMRERVEAMINLAHPDFRDQIRDEVKQSGLFG